MSIVLNPPGVQTVLYLARTQQAQEPRQEFEPHLGFNLTLHRAEIHLFSEQSFQYLHKATFMAAAVNSQLAGKRPEDASGRLGDFKNKGCQPFSISAGQ